MVTVINTSNDIIRVEISDIDIDTNVHPNSMLRISLTLFQTYNIKMTKARNVQRTAYVVCHDYTITNLIFLCSCTPVEEGQTLNVARYFS